MLKVCTKCLSRRSQKVSRAGTPGFRPPEVLLKSAHQTTAVDLWAVGVIFISAMTRTYPFFRAPDDVTNLAEMLAIFGTKALTEAASQYGKRLVTSAHVEPWNLELMCACLAGRGRDKDYSVATALVTKESVDLLKNLFALNAAARITAEDALKHPFFKD